MTSDMLLHDTSGIQGTYSVVVACYYIHCSKGNYLRRCYNCRLSTSKPISALSVLLASLVRDAMNGEKVLKQWQRCLICLD